MPILLIAIAGVVAAGLLYSRTSSASSMGEKMSPPPSSPPSSSITKIPVGIRQNNPTNLKGKGWVGQIGSDSRGHAIFDKVERGLRAAFIDIHTGFVRDQEDTVDAIIHEWAGAEAPNITAYKSYVAGRLRVSTKQPLQYSVHALALVKAISAFENSPYNTESLPYEEARRLANKG